MRPWISLLLLAAALLPATAAGAQTAVATPPGSASPSAPVPGKNSFTENQARMRMISAGFIDIGTLTLDEKGIWRAAAVKDAAHVTVSLDYQGNVTAR